MANWRSGTASILIASRNAHLLYFCSNMNQDSGQNLTEPSRAASRWLFVAAAFFLISLSFLIASRRNAVDIDLFHEMALARQIHEEGVFPLTDSFAYTPTVEKVVHHEWGTGAIAFAIIELTGLKSRGLMALKYSLVVLIGIACFLSCHWRGAKWPLIVPGLALATILGGQIGYTTIRAQLFTMLFLACEFSLLAIDQQDRKWWIGPWLILVVIWANVHAGIVAGLGIFSVYVLFRLGQSLLSGSDTKSRYYLVAVAIASYLLLLVNPYGINYPFYLLYGTTLERPLINEWQPLLSTVNDSGFLTLLGISFALAMVGAVKDFKERPFEVFVILLTAYLAFKHVRHLSIYAVTWACIVPASLGRHSIGTELTKIGNRLAKPIAFAAAVGGVFFTVQAIEARFWEMQVPAYTDDAEPNGMLYPVAAVGQLKNSGFKGNLMTPFSVGAFVSWNLYPAVKVSIDSRYEVAYPQGSIEESFDFYDAKPGWKETLSKYSTDAILVPNYKPLREKLDQLQNWHMIYTDEMFSIFSNVPPGREPVRSKADQVGWEF